MTFEDHSMTIDLTFFFCTCSTVHSMIITIVSPWEDSALLICPLEKYLLVSQFCPPILDFFSILFYFLASWYIFIGCFLIFILHSSKVDLKSFLTHSLNLQWQLWIHFVFPGLCHYFWQNKWSLLLKEMSSLAEHQLFILVEAFMFLLLFSSLCKLNEQAFIQDCSLHLLAACPCCSFVPPTSMSDWTAAQVLSSYQATVIICTGALKMEPFC